jgi:ATP-dependent DNA helicase RecG
MEETTDGFRIAEEDLKIRGPGDFIGTRQAGLPDLRLSFALSDIRVLKEARAEAFGFIKGDPELSTPEGKVIREVLGARWAERLELAGIG